MHRPDPIPNVTEAVNAESLPDAGSTQASAADVSNASTPRSDATVTDAAVGNETVADPSTAVPVPSAPGAATPLAATPINTAVPTDRAHIVDANSANDTIELDLIKGFAQEVNWGVNGASTMVIDEPEPLGENRGPSPGRVLAAALASCLGASLLFCLKKSRIDVQGLHTTASVALTRNDKGRLRVGTITVRLEPIVPLDHQPRMARCLEVFEDFCIVTASVRPAVTVDVSVHPVAPGA